MSEVLSQEEINTLLKGLSEGEIEEGTVSEEVDEDDYGDEDRVREDRREREREDKRRRSRMLERDEAEMQAQEDLIRRASIHDREDHGSGRGSGSGIYRA